MMIINKFSFYMNRNITKLAVNVDYHRLRKC